MVLGRAEIIVCWLASFALYTYSRPRYSHVRFDAVHYCDLEVELAAKRKHRSFFDRNSVPVDAPQVRLALFLRSVRESPELGKLVLSLRMPYMMREANKSDIARTVSVLPNLRYVDLPAGIYSDESSCSVLKQELIVRCPDIRRMSYRHGSEGTFFHLPESRPWTNLEVLEISGVQVDARSLRLVLGSLPKVHDLTLESLPWLDESSFGPSQSLPKFPPVRRLCLVDTPSVTVNYILSFLSVPANRNALQSLTLSSTGVVPSALHQILSAVPHLRELLVTQEVSHLFPVEKVPPLASRSLKLLHYEITSATGSYGTQPVSNSYYTYLISSLMANSLPALRDLYVRDAQFPETLLLAPPPRLVGGGEIGPQSMGCLRQSLNVYSKGTDELEWNFTPYDPSPTDGRRNSVTRPVTFHEAQLSRPWAGKDARKSVLVGNGFGGFLAVPVDDGRPKSSGGRKRDSRQDLWR